jgi:hypothetical protein
MPRVTLNDLESKLFILGIDPEANTMALLESIGIKKAYRDMETGETIREAIANTPA